MLLDPDGRSEFKLRATEGGLAGFGSQQDQAAINDATLPLDSVEAEKSSNSRVRRSSPPPSCRNTLRKAKISSAAQIHADLRA